MILESAVAVLLHLVSLAATENMAVHERDLRGVRKQDAMAEAPLTDKFKRQVFVTNVMRIKEVIVGILDFVGFIKSCLEWEDVPRSIMSFIIFMSSISVELS